MSKLRLESAGRRVAIQLPLLHLTNKYRHVSHLFDPLSIMILIVIVPYQLECNPWFLHMDDSKSHNSDEKHFNIERFQALSFPSISSKPNRRPVLIHVI